jgi:hypothetical protein
MAPAALAVLRAATLAAGAVAGPLLVRSLDAGLSGAERPLGAGHVAAGLAAAAAAMPGPILGLLVTPASSERARGLAVGGSAVTALAALFAGAMAVRALRAPGGAAGWVEAAALAWALAALPLAAADFLRLRGGAEG